MALTDTEFLVAYLELYMFTKQDVWRMTQNSSTLRLYPDAEHVLKDWAEWLMPW